MRLVNSHSIEKWEKTNIPKLWGSEIFHVKQKAMKFPNYGKSELPYYGTSVKNTNSQVLLYLTDLEFMGTHAIPNAWQCANSHIMEIFCGKPAISFPGRGFLWKIELIKTSKECPEHESSKISYYGNTKGKNTLFPWYRLWLRINWVRQPTQLPDMGN